MLCISRCLLLFSLHFHLLFVSRFRLVSSRTPSLVCVCNLLTHCAFRCHSSIIIPFTPRCVLSRYTLTRSVALHFDYPPVHPQLPLPLLGRGMLGLCCPAIAWRRQSPNPNRLSRDLPWFCLQRCGPSYARCLLYAGPAMHCIAFALLPRCVGTEYQTVPQCIAAK